MELELNTTLKNEQNSFLAIHNLQYERISSLEQQENYITTFVSGLSTITISFTSLSTLSVITGIYLPLVFIAANIIATLYILKTRGFIKMHQKRAEKIRKDYIPNIQILYEGIDKVDSNKDFFNRTNMMICLHGIISIIGLAIFITFLSR